MAREGKDPFEHAENSLSAFGREALMSLGGVVLKDLSLSLLYYF